MTTLDFVGQPFDPTAWGAEEAPAPATSPTAPTASEPGMIARLRAALVDAHATALRAQESWQRIQLAAPPTPSRPRSDEGAFKPLARTQVVRFGEGELRRLAAGDVPSVFGSRYDQRGANPDVRLSGDVVLTDVREIDLRGGAHRRGRLSAGTKPGADPVAVAVQAAELFALYTGLHLCLADARRSNAPSAPVASTAWA